MKAKLYIYKDLVFETVKRETYIKGNFDRVAGQGTSSAPSYFEMAGDEDYAERKLEQTYHTALASLCTFLASFLGSTPEFTNLTDDNGNEQNVTLITLEGIAFDSATMNALAQHCSSYLAHAMLIDWWGTFHGEQASAYAIMQSKDGAEIRQCLLRRLPYGAEIPYPTRIDILISTVRIKQGETATVTYSTDGDESVMDDIQCCPDSHIIKVWRERGTFYIRGMAPGRCGCLLFSAHDELNVRSRVFVIVEENREYIPDATTHRKEEPWYNSIPDIEPHIDRFRNPKEPKPHRRKGPHIPPPPLQK